MVTNEQAQKWRELAEAATPGEWKVITWADSADFIIEGDSDFLAYLNNNSIGDKKADAAFIAAARTAVPALLSERDALAALWAQVVAIAEESTNSTTYISAYNMSRVRDLVREWKEAQHAVLE